jgi:hypothetical protein
MAKCILLPSVLWIWGCSQAGEALPSDFLLRPAQFEQIMWADYSWRLTPGIPPELSPRDQFGKGRWFTLSQGASPRYLFEEFQDRLEIYHLGKGDQVAPLAQILLPLRPGMAWASRYALPGQTPDTLTEWASCTPERITLESGSYDVLRVDFSQSGHVRHSLCFAPGLGLVQWAGINGAPIFRTDKGLPELLLSSAARTYLDYGRVDDDLRTAPTDCKAPAPPSPRRSASRDGATHGRKMYYLFARDRLAYLHARDLDQPEGQILVKESWIPGEPRMKGPLFLMMKTGGDWIYATASPEKKTLTAWGSLASCRECHESASTRDRMFGLPTCAAAK